MPTFVELPDKTELEFPDGMDEIAMRREIIKAFPQFAKETPSESVAVSAPGESPLGGSPRAASLIPEAFPAETQRRQEMQAAKTPELSGAEVESMLMTPQITIPNVIPKSFPITRGVFETAKGIPEFITAPGAPLVAMAQQIPFVREVVDAAMGAGMVKSAATLAGEASVTGDREQMAQAVSSGLLGATMLAGPHVAPIAAREIEARQVGPPDVAVVDVATEALRNQAIKEHTTEAQLAANERPVTLKPEPKTGIQLPEARELTAEEAERLILKPTTEAANQEIQNAIPQREAEALSVANAPGDSGEVGAQVRQQAPTERQAQEAEVNKPAQLPTEQAPETQAPTAATVSEAKPEGVAAPSEPPAISQPTSKSEITQAGWDKAGEIQRNPEGYYEQIENGEVVGSDRDFDSLMRTWGESNAGYSQRIVETAPGKFELFLKDPGEAESVRELVPYDAKSKAKYQLAEATGKPEAAVAGQEPVSKGPGAAAAGEPGTYSAISELADKLKTTPAKTSADGLRAGEKIANAWSAGKSLVTQAVGKLLAVPAALKGHYEYTRRFDDVTRQIGKFDYLIQSSAGKSRDAGRAMRQSIRNKAIRDSTGFYIEGADKAQIQTALANLPKGTKPYIRRALEAALKLPEDVRSNADDMAQFYFQRGREAVEEGVLDHLLEDYYTHIWRDTRNMPAKLAMALNRGRVNEYFQYALHRKIPTLLEGILEGKEPVLDPASVIPRYNYLLDRAIASRHLMKSLEDLTVTEKDPATGKTRTRPLLAPVGTRRTIYDKNQVPQARLIKVHIAGEEASDYRAIDHPSLRKWIWAATDDQGVPVFYEGDLRVHPAYHERLARMMDRSRLTARPAMRRALALSTEVKGFKLGVASFFHPIQVGTHALFHHISPLVRGEIDWDSPKTRFAIEKGGLHIGPSPDAISSFAEGILTRGLVNKIPFIGPWSHALAEWTFADYIPRLKLATFEHFYERARKKYPNLTEEEAAARAGSSANYAYGELNQLWLGKEGRDPGTQRMLRLAFLAPDFGESRLSFVLKAATKYGGEERLGLVTAATSLWLASRIGNILSHGDPELHDKKHLFDVKIGERWYGVRSIVGDIGHLVTKARQFWEVRLNPLYSRTLLAGLSGRDVSGHKLTPGRFAADVAKQVVPIHLSGLTRDDRQVWESMLAAIGLQTWKAGATTEIHRLAQDWRGKRGIKDDTEVLAGPDSPYRKARLALEFGNRQDFRQAIQDLYKQRKALGDPTPRETVKRNFNRYYHQPFSGNARLEGLFKRSLSMEERAVYQDAQKEREKLWREFQAWF